MKNRRPFPFSLSIPLLLVLSLGSYADTPNWIWHGHKGAAIQTNEICFLRKTFHLETKPAKALLTVAAGDEATVYLNGRQVARAEDYDKPTLKDVTSETKRGENVIAIRAKNLTSEGPGVLVVLDIKINNKQSEFITSDNT